jgi:lipoyl(octanoyl) transferase
LNVDLDLRPFADINPCGYEGLAVTRTKDWNVSGGVDDLAPELAGHFQQLLSR